MDIVVSKYSVPIRLTEERWFHIIENHDDLAGHYDNVLQTIEDPDTIIEGYKKALIALRRISRNKFLAVVYKEIGDECQHIVHRKECHDIVQSKL